MASKGVMLVELDKVTQAKLDAISRELSTIGLSIPGSVTLRTYQCGKANCACHVDPSKVHGPYISWTRKVNNKTVTKLLTQEQLDEYQEYFSNSKRLKELIHEIESLSMEVIEKDPRWK